MGGSDMADIRSKLNMLYSLEQLSSGENAFKKLHSLAKLIVTAVYLVCVASLGKYDLTRLTLFLAYPVLMMAMAQIPWKMILKRAAVAMPFCIFAGVSNLIFDRTVIAYAGKIAVTGGMLSFAMLLCRTLLCVSAILILVAVTPFSELMDQLRRLHVPELLVTLLEMVYRYIGVLVEEASGMVTAFRLRGNGAKWPGFQNLAHLSGSYFCAVQTGQNGSIKQCSAGFIPYMMYRKKNQNGNYAIPFSDCGCRDLRSVQMDRFYGNIRRNFAMIAMQDWTVTYPDGTIAVDHLNLKIQPGEHLAIIGANGAGKSSLILSMVGVIPGSGRIHVDGVELNKKNLTEIRKKSAWYFRIRMISYFCQRSMMMLPLDHGIWEWMKNRCVTV